MDCRLPVTVLSRPSCRSPGIDPMDEAALRARLDACLVPSRGFAPEAWIHLEDPFPAWMPPAGA